MMKISATSSWIWSCEHIFLDQSFLQYFITSLLGQSWSCPHIRQLMRKLYLEPFSFCRYGHGSWRGRLGKHMNFICWFFFYGYLGFETFFSISLFFIITGTEEAKPKPKWVTMGKKHSNFIYVLGGKISVFIIIPSFSELFCHPWSLPKYLMGRKLTLMWVQVEAWSNTILLSHNMIASSQFLCINV